MKVGASKLSDQGNTMNVFFKHLSRAMSGYNAQTQELPVMARQIEDEATLELIFEEIESAILRRAATERRAQTLVQKTLESCVPLRAVSQMIFKGKKYEEIVAFLDAHRFDVKDASSRGAAQGSTAPTSPRPCQTA